MQRFSRFTQVIIIILLTLSFTLIRSSRAIAEPTANRSELISTGSNSTEPNISELSDLNLSNFDDVYEQAVSIRSLREFVLKLRATFTKPDLFSSESCQPVLQAVNKAIYLRSPLSFDLSDYYQQDASGGPLLYRANNGKKYPELNEAKLESLFNGLFTAKTLVRERIREMIQKETFTDAQQMAACVDAARMTIRTLRSWEDYWGQFVLTRMHVKEKTLTSTASQWKHNPAIELMPLTGGFPHLKVNSRMRQRLGLDSSQVNQLPLHVLQSGDLMLSRGKAFSGAVFANIAAIDNQFSHAALLYKDNKRLFKEIDSKWYPDKVYVIEAVPKGGLTFEPLETYYPTDITRMALFRYRHLNPNLESILPSQELSAYAAENLARKAISNYKSDFTEILYDYRMDLNDHSELFCAEAIHVAFKNACHDLALVKGQTVCDTNADGEVIQFPMFASTFHPDHPFLKDVLHVDIESTFAPADIEVDPRLEVLAEWRNYFSLKTSHYHDMIITKLLQWMEEENYHFSEDLVAEELKPFFKEGSQFSKSILVELHKMPAHTPNEFVQATLVLGFMIEFPAMGQAKGFIETLWNFSPSLLPFGVDPIQLLKRHNMVPLSDQTWDHITNYVGLAAFLKAKEIQHQADQQEAIDRLISQQRMVEGLVHPMPLTDYELDQTLEMLRIVDCRLFKQRMAGTYDGPLMIHHTLRKRFDSVEDACYDDEYEWKSYW